MPHLAVAAVECLRNHTVEVAHQPRQVRAARVQHDVIVIAPKAIGQHLRVKALHALLQHAEQRSPVAVVLENWLVLVAAGGDVVARPRELDAQGAEHGAKDCGGGGKRQDLTPGLHTALFSLWRIMWVFTLDAMVIKVFLDPIFEPSLKVNSQVCFPGQFIFCLGTFVVVVRDIP